MVVYYKLAENNYTFSIWHSSISIVYFFCRNGSNTIYNQHYIGVNKVPLKKTLVYISTFTLLLSSLSATDLVSKVTDSKKIETVKKKPKTPGKAKAKKIYMERLEDGKSAMVFEGEASMKDGTNTIHADKIRIISDKDRKFQEAIATGTPKKPIVVLNENGEKAYAGKGVFDAKNNIITLSEKPIIEYKDGNLLIDAKNIIIDRDPEAKVPFTTQGGDPKLVIKDVDDFKDDPNKDKLVGQDKEKTPDKDKKTN